MIGFAVYMFVSSASAESLDEIVAEQSRLRREIQNLIRKGAWRGVDRVYVQLITLERPEAPLLFSDHIAGARASKELGVIQNTIKRLEAAILLNPAAKEKEWLRFLRRKTGYANINSRAKSATKLVIDQIPFEPELQKSIEMAEKTLHQTGEFVGFLPRGKYKFGDLSFQVPPKPKSPTKVKKPPQKTNPSDASIALRIGASGTFMSEGQDNGPDGFFAPGLVAGGQYKYPLKSLWFAGELNAGFYGTMDVQMFSGQVVGFSGFRTSIGDIGLGVLFDFSTGRIFGLNTQYVDDACPDCANPDVLQSESYFYGYSTSVGSVFSYSFPIKDKVGLDMRFGSRYDNFRWYTWGAISSTIQLGQ